jgi:hypothetical protein
MKLDRLCGVVLAIAAPLAAQTPLPQPDLQVLFRADSVVFRVTQEVEQPFLGVVIAALDPQLTHYLTALPPLLTDFVVLGYGVGEGPSGYQLPIRAALFPSGVMLYAQGVVIDPAAVLASPVRDFVLDGSATN